MRNGASVAASPSLRAAAVDESPLLSRSAERELLRQLGQMDATMDAVIGDEVAPQADPAELVVDQALSNAAELAADADAIAIAAEVGAAQRAEAEVERIQATAQAQVSVSASADDPRVIAQIRAEASREVEEARARAQEEAQAAQAEADSRVAAAAKQVEEALAQAEQSALLARQGTQRASEEQAELQRQIDARAAALAAQAAERIAQAHEAAEGSMAFAAQQAERAILERAEQAQADAASAIAKVEQEANERVERVRREASLQAATHEEQLAGAHALAAQATEQCDSVVQATDKQIAELRQMCAVVQEQAEASREAARAEAARAVEEVTGHSAELAAQVQATTIENESLKLSLRQREAQSSVQISAAQERGAVLVRETELMMMRLMQAWSNRRALLDAVRAWQLYASSVAARRRTLRRTARRLQENRLRRVCRAWAAGARRLRQHSMVQWQRRLHDQLAVERTQAAGERSEAEALIVESQQAAEELCAAAESSRAELAEVAAAKHEAEERARLAVEAAAAQEKELSALREQLKVMHTREEQWSNATAAAISVSIADASNANASSSAAAAAGLASANMVSEIRPLNGILSADESTQRSGDGSRGNSSGPSGVERSRPHRHSGPGGGGGGGGDDSNGSMSMWSSSVLQSSSAMAAGGAFHAASALEVSQAEAVDAA